MILVDSSVWIDFFRETQNKHTLQLVKWLQGNDIELAVADLVIFEVMRGFLLPKDQVRAKQLLLSLTVVEIGGLDNALIAAEHYHALRQRGYTIRSPIDVLLASYCITHGHHLLHRDADFDVMEILRGLKTWPH
ncbi:type II toxin-antitoxin system VapC family toxin [Rhodoferax antarcticus]|uniref:Ribonuclease VapC n=1 Tax=Rhodoferax antarcticus ANT.BR TaxID=1111071 RepID=A0A1Q8YCJ3_9BURK|nr:PIN domain nuclease [Rhodoferax antarcticus]APW45686.1 VapC toxin family PIN domain ribonuclease [Rhodoferax antarcticus]MCW2310848.1 putative nucleic acid-binding protein [Rhodoferax antarcticus]OLP05722.1 PIN domain protein [Rhodoferax antarcticus ANT.BR]